MRATFFLMRRLQLPGATIFPLKRPKSLPKPKSPRRKKKQGVFGKVLAGLMAGLLMGAAIGVGVVGMLENREKPEADIPYVEQTPIPTPTPTPVLNVSSLAAGEMPATDI